MKRMILASLIGLLASGAYASDLSYGGPYSQMKVKLCSDTPPSRSILPDGSLICDDNPPMSDTYCTGGFVYADTDIFNCGSQVEQDGDLNNNGIPDSDEDWDGDGLANGVDPNPTLNDNVDLDEDNNGIPDKLDPFFETYKASRAEVVTCDGADPDCRSADVALYGLMNTNRDLTNIINLMAEGNTSKQFRTTLENLRETMTFQEIQTRKELSDLEYSVRNIDRGVDNTALIKSEFKEVDEQFSSVENELDDMEGILWDVKSIDSDSNSMVKTLPTQINAVHQHMDANKGQLVDVINNASIALTIEQQNQLIDASKAKANQKILKQLRTTVGENKNTLSRVESSLSNVTDDVNQNTNEKFNQLSDQIAAISGGQSTVDLSGVESSIGEISGKLDGLATGVTDIGDLLKDVDSSKAGIDGTCIQGGTCKGFYESAYDGDLSDVVVGQLDSMKTSIVDPFVSSFGNIDLSGAQRPKFGLPVPFYGYMSFDNYIDMDWIFGFLRFIFLASTAFYCRQIIFGG
ncbi:hypothetical protein FCV50_11455 [Vibrio kanaloae]|uniref:Methyl-accepting chemotaxis protein n=1 Tax=Vibrio kanaloae TaxID=170673 RepID=A0A4U1ZCD1_9VIBR|nr:hypothetical protein [Vibrio kanaloae]TKF31652.1 hypothetical protein FCV50_11455 [Vibrio kanaloae]